MKRLNIKGIVIVTALTVILTGCSNTQNITTNKENYNTSATEQIEQIPTTEDNTPIVEESKPTIEETTPVVEETSEQKVLTYFENAKKEVVQYIESEEFEQLKEKGKYYVTTGIDFIFFDQPIKGVYFDDLTEELKKDILREVKSLDKAVMAYYPDYKEDISSKYQIASEFVSEKYLEIMDEIKEYLGEENYNAVGEIKDQIKEDISEKTDEGIDYIKDLYNDWKNRK